MFKSVILTATFKQSQITIAGTIINGVLGALFYIFLARLLGPAEFGLLTVTITTLVLIADIADIGTNTGLVRFVSLNLAKNPNRAYQFLKLSLEVKLMTWFIFFIAIFLLAPFLATEVFHKQQLIFDLRLAGFGIGGALLFTFATSALQAYQKYFVWSLVNISTNFLRLLTILILSYMMLLNIQTSLLVYIILPFFGFFVTLFILPLKKIFYSKHEVLISKQLFKYNIPVAVFTVIAALAARLDTYLTAALLSSKEVGIYGVANQLVQVMPQLVAALGLVSSPKFASFQSHQQMLIYFRKFQLFVFGLVVIAILIIPILGYIIPIILGVQYQASVVPFIMLFLAQLIFLFSIPVHHAVIFYFSRSDIFIWVSIGNLLIIGLLGYMMTSHYGVIGAALTVIVGNIFNFLYPSIWLFMKLKNKD